MSQSESFDESYKDQKYFVSDDIYNCPFCNRRHVSYTVVDKLKFNWSRENIVFGYIVQCGSCTKKSLHLSYFDFSPNYSSPYFRHPPENLKEELKKSFDVEQLDAYFFYNKPTSFFVIDNRIPKVARELISESEGCRDMGYMTGASGALRRAIYKFLKHEKLSGASYEDKIKNLKQKYPMVPEEYVDALSNVQGMTSTNLHEDYDFEPWTPEQFTFLIKAYSELMVEIYVKPSERSESLKKIIELNPFADKNKSKT